MGVVLMVSQPSQRGPGLELQAAFRRHLPQRLRTLLGRVRAQCQSGWDCNVLRALHDEIAVLAGTCGRYGMLATGERLLALESALASPLAAERVPDAAASREIEGMLDSLRPTFVHSVSGAPEPPWSRGTVEAREPFPRCEVPPDKYWLKLGIADPSPDDAGTPGASTGDADTLDGGDSLPLRSSPLLGAEVARGICARVVDDDDPAVTELMLRLMDRGCDVAPVAGIDGLLELLHTTPPDLAVVLADDRTPLDRLAAVLRETRRNTAQRVRLLVLLREPAPALQLHAMRAGADRCIALPAAAEATVQAALELMDLDRNDAYRILIVDDDAPQALFAQAILRHAGMETEILGESLAVLDELDRFRPDLLLLDLNMPDCDGFELTALIRGREGYVNTPIVFLSGEMDEDRQFAALDAGADDFLVKPIRPAHLVAAVTNRVRRARVAAARETRPPQHGADAVPGSRAQLLNAISGHLVGSTGLKVHGGLLAIEVDNAVAVRASCGLATTDPLPVELGAFIAGHAGAGCLTAPEGKDRYLVFTPARAEPALVALALQLVTAARDARFGAREAVAELRCAVFAFDATTSEPGAALAGLERALAQARLRPDRVGLYAVPVSGAPSLLERMAEALAHDSFGLAFQPILPIRGAAEPQYQALLRLHDAGHDYVAADLIPVAVRAGMIAAIDAWVVKRCIAILAERMGEGDPVRMFASQSLEGWKDPARTLALPAALDAAAVPADGLVLEFRADEVRDDPAALTNLATTLRLAGVRFSLSRVDPDTMATEWARKLPLDYVKLAPDLDDAALAEVVHGAHALAMRVVAPRVERFAQLERLRAAKVDLLQGNFFRAPRDQLGDPLPPLEA